MNGCPQEKHPLLQLAMSGSRQVPLLRMGQEVTHTVIVHSFKACRISSSNDSSDDGFIHCLKPSRVAQSDGFI